MKKRSSPTSSIQVSTTQSGTAAPPCMTYTRLDRSRSRTSSTRAMRASIVGTAAKHATRHRSTSSSARAASNFSISTMESPLRSVLCAMPNPLVWYSGAGMSWGSRSGSGPYAAGIGSSAPGTYWPGCGLTISFGRPVDPLDAIAAAGHATTSGSGVAGNEVPAARTSSSVTTGVRRPGPSPSVSVTNTTAAASSSRGSSSHGGRSRRSGRTPAPTFHAPIVATTCSGEFARPIATIVPGPAPPRREQPADLVRPLVELTPRHDQLAPGTDAGKRDRRPVGIGLCELRDAASERDGAGNGVGHRAQ